VPGSSTTPGCPSACVGALGHIAFRYTDSVSTWNQFSVAAQWLACTFPCRRFADILANACARLGADVVRYSFIVVDLHHLLLAGLPAHLCENVRHARRRVFTLKAWTAMRAAHGHAVSPRRGCTTRSPHVLRLFLLYSMIDRIWTRRFWQNEPNLCCNCLIGVPCIAFIPLAIEVLGHQAELDDQIDPDGTRIPIQAVQES
jgi:hypothetical protein